MRLSLGLGNRFSCRPLLAGAIALCLEVGAAAAATITGRCIAVPDGDTILVRDTNRRRIEVRLQGIDAPEKGQRYGTVSKSHLTGLVYQKEVEVDWNKRDHYGRLVGRVYAGDIDVNLTQVEAGLAWVYREYLDELSVADRKLFLETEAVARDKHLGLWRDRKPTPPWEWRHRQ